MSFDPQSRRFTILLGVLAALPALSIDIGAPALALLPAELGTDAGTAGLTVSGFMAGFAVGQLAGGRASDLWGRRPVLLLGLSVFVLAGLACTAAGSAASLIAARAVQGGAAGGCSVLSFAIVQDLFSGADARRRQSTVTVVFGTVPMVAPSIGTMIIALAGWRGAFAVLPFAGALLLPVAWFGLAESRRPRSAVRESHPEVPPMWRHGHFLVLCAANAFSYACIFCYIAGSPLVIIGQLGYGAPVFAGLFAMTAAALTGGAAVSGRLGRRDIHPVHLVLSGAALQLAACLLLLAAAPAATPSVLLLCAVLFGRGLAAPNLQFLAIRLRQGWAGSAAAAVGVSQLLAGAAASAVTSAAVDRAGLYAIIVPMSVLAACSLVAAFSARFASVPAR